MNKKEIFAHFSEILDDMLYHSLFFDMFLQQPSSIEDIEGSIDDPAVPENIRINFGATRACIVDRNYEYVVKFDIEEDARGSACEREEAIYEQACAEGLEQYFAHPLYLGTYTKEINFYDYYNIDQHLDWYGYDEDFESTFMDHEDEFGPIRPIVISIPLYAYPRASRLHPNYGRGKEEEAKYESIARSVNSPLRERNLAVAIDFIREFGEVAYYNLTNFMYKMDVNDLHMGNIGEVEGHFALIDYAGYHSAYSSETEGESYFE